MAVLRKRERGVDVSDEAQDAAEDAAEEEYLEHDEDRDEDHFHLEEEPPVEIIPGEVEGNFVTPRDNQRS